MTAGSSSYNRTSARQNCLAEDYPHKGGCDSDLGKPHVLISMPKVVEHGLAGEMVSRRATFLLKGVSILVFLLV